MTAHIHLAPHYEHLLNRLNFKMPRFRDPLKRVLMIHTVSRNNASIEERAKNDAAVTKNRMCVWPDPP